MCRGLIRLIRDGYYFMRLSRTVVPAGLGVVGFALNPVINHRASVCRPCGTEKNLLFCGFGGGVGGFFWCCGFCFCFWFFGLVVFWVDLCGRGFFAFWGWVGDSCVIEAAETLYDGCFDFVNLSQGQRAVVELAIHHASRDHGVDLVFDSPGGWVRNGSDT